jgi:diguanylate cyclase (GGDEF)-like protein
MDYDRVCVVESDCVFQGFAMQWIKRRTTFKNVMRAIEKTPSRPESNGEKKVIRSSRLKKPKLTDAIRILQHAGLPDPTKISRNLNVQLQTLIDSLCDLSVHDGLTELVNATFFHAVISGEIDRSARTGRSCGLILIDIDHFKNINDDYGHHAGDMALRSLARRLRKSLRNMDTAARIGGEEFAVILPECIPEDAIHAASRLHGMLNPFTIKLGRKSLRITASMGLVWTDEQQTSSSKTLLARADRELYRAKQEGRGRLCHPKISSTQMGADERAALIASRIDEGNDAN